MPELIEITQLILKHLPPSADLPAVRPLDDRGRRWCMALERQREIRVEAVHAADATVASDMALVPEAVTALRPNGRAIFLVPNTDSLAVEDFVAALASAGLVRILTEPVLGAAFILARGERPTGHERPIDRVAAIAQAETGPALVLEAAEAARRHSHLHLLVQQHPSSRGWDDMTPGTIWQAATVRDTQADRVVLLAFTSLVKAVAFMQPAVIAGVIQNIDKLPRFETQRMIAWHTPIMINPVFEALREDPRYDVNSPRLRVDPVQAARSSE